MALALVTHRIFPAAQAPATIIHRVDVAASILDGYTGYYQWEDDDLITIVSRKGDRLFIQYPGANVAEITPQSETQFVTKNGGQLYFTRDNHGRATSINIPVNDTSSSAPRIDPALGRQIFAIQATKLRDNTATPGSAQALRRVIEEAKSGQPNYGEIRTQLAQFMRRDPRLMQKQLNFFGTVQSIEFIGVDNNCGDIYEVTQERAYTEWHINLGRNGAIKYWFYDVEKPVMRPM